MRIVERDSGNNLSASGKDTTESKVIAENYKVRLAYLVRREIESDLPSHCAGRNQSSVSVSRKKEIYPQNISLIRIPLRLSSLLYSSSHCSSYFFFKYFRLLLVG